MLDKRIFFLLKNSLKHLENFMKTYYVFSIGFNDIYYGNKKFYLIFILHSKMCIRLVHEINSLINCIIK